MKKIAILISALIMLVATSLFCACGGPKADDNNSPDNNTNTSTDDGNGNKNDGNSSTDDGNSGADSGTEKPVQQTFEGITFADETLQYDGTEHEITVSGTVPEGAQVTYSGNKGTDAGVYNASVTLSKENYKSLTLTAKLTITKADWDASNIVFSDSKVEYDTLSHSIQIVGNLPSDATVKYYYDGNEVSGVSAVGKHNVKAVVSRKNHVDKEFLAELEISSTEKALYSAVVNGKIYFQNDLDDDKLYSVSGAQVVKVSNDVPNYMISDGSNLYFFSTSLFSKVIKGYSGSTFSNIVSVGGEYLATDGEYVYYAVNNLVINTDKNGIYKFKLDGSEETAVRLTTDKAEYLTYIDGYIYYSNKSNHGYLYRISTSANEQNGTLISEEKAEYLITDGTNLYYNSTKAAAGVVGYASAITKFVVSSSKIVKLTTDSGKYLTLIGNDIYYINNDKLTSVLFGDGIYKVSALSVADNSLPGVKVISAENNGYSSLSSDGSNLYYYKLNDKHFYKYVISSESEVDLMANFTVPEEKQTPTGYSVVKEYNGEIYYTDPLDLGCLYKYNPQTSAKFKVLADSVSNVWFNGGYMYYTTYILTNYALFRLNLSDNSIVKISSDRCENLIFEGSVIYYTKITAGSNSIWKMNLDGTDAEMLYDDKSPNVFGFEKAGSDIYFIMNPAVGRQYIYKFNVQTKTAVNSEIKAKNLLIAQNKIYYFDGTDSTLKECNLDFTGQKTLVSDVDINDMYFANGKIYYSSSANNKTGLFAYDLSAQAVSSISNKQAHGMVFYNGSLYFIQSKVTYTDGYPVQASGLDVKLYRYNGTVAKV